MGNRIVRKAGLYFLGSASTKLMGIALVPVYAFYVDTASLGSYDYLLALGLIVTPTLYLAIWEAALRYLISEGGSTGAISRASTTASIVAFALVATFIGCILTALLQPFGFLSARDAWTLMAIVATTGLAQVWQYIARACDGAKLFVTAGIISAVVSFVLVIVLVVILRMQLAGLLIAYLAGQLVVIIRIELGLHVVGSLRFRNIDLSHMRPLLTYSIPLFANLVALALVGGFGKLLLVGVFGEDANGVYSFALKFAAIVVTLGTILSMSIIEEGMLRAGSPTLAAFYTQVLNALTAGVMILITVLTPAIYVSYELFFQTTEYASSRPLIPAVMLFAGFSVVGTQVGSVFMTVGRTGFLGLSTILGAFVTVVTSLLLVRPLGTQGVALGLILGSGTIMVTRIIVSRRHVEYTWLAGRATLALLVYLLVAGGAEALAHAGKSSLMYGYAVGVLLACSWPLYASLQTIRKVPDEVTVL